MNPKYNTLHYGKKHPKKCLLPESIRKRLGKESSISVITDISSPGTKDDI